MAKLSIDSSEGGLGDIWMRLNALYSLTLINPKVSVRFRIPKHLFAVAQIAFSGRFLIETMPLKGAYQFGYLGLRHLLPKILRGERFACPFTRMLQTERKRTRMKDVVNDGLFALASATRRIKQPTLASVRTYQGFHEFSMFPELRVSYSEFIEQAKRDKVEIRARLRHHWPKMNSPRADLLVFPGGSAHQIMPPGWARLNLPGASFAFFAGDPFQLEFQALGLQTENFNSVEELLTLLSSSKKALVTDSFPSHVAQNYTDATTVMLTEQLLPRTVNPAFAGSVVQTAAPCAPCKHIARGMGLCEAGHDFCVTWLNPGYAKDMLANNL